MPVLTTRRRQNTRDTETQDSPAPPPLAITTQSAAPGNAGHRFASVSVSAAPALIQRSPDDKQGNHAPSWWQWAEQKAAGVSHAVSSTAQAAGHAVSGATHAAGEMVSPVVSEVSHVASMAAGEVGQTASRAAHVMEPMAAKAWHSTQASMKANGDLIHRGEATVGHGVDWVEKKEEANSREAVASVKGIPVLEQIAKAGAAVGNAETHFLGGMARHLTTQAGNNAMWYADPLQAPGDIYKDMKANGDLIHRGEAAVGHGVDWVEKKEEANSREAVASVKGIPVLEQIAKAGAAVGNAETQFEGGIVRGATGLVGGIANALANPVDTMRGLETMGEHISPIPGIPISPIPNPLKAAHGLLNVATGRETMTQLGQSLMPLESMKDDAQFQSQIVKSLVGQYSEQWKQRKYADVIGHAGFDIASFVLPVASELNIASKGVKVAEVVSDASRVAEVVSDASRDTELITAGSRDTEPVAAVHSAEPAAARAVENVNADIAKGFGKLEGRKINVSEKGLNEVTDHLSNFTGEDGKPYWQNQEMIGHLRKALAEKQPVSEANASFYMHELNEAKVTKQLMDKGQSFEEAQKIAHESAFKKYDVSHRSVYTQDVVKKLRSEGQINESWEKFWEAREGRK